MSQTKASIERQMHEARNLAEELNGRASDLSDLSRDIEEGLNEQLDAAYQAFHINPSASHWTACTDFMLAWQEWLTGV